MNMREPIPVADWLGLLVLLCNPPEAEDTTDNMAPMIPFLMAFPSWAFCPASAQAVEAFDRRRAVPSLSEIERPLRGWLDRNHRPAPKVEGLLVDRRYHREIGL